MADSTVTRGTVFFPEISGIDYLPDGDRLLLVSDEHGLRFVDDAVAQLRRGTVTPRATGHLGKSVEDCPLEDCEDAVFDGGHFLYVVTSHSLNRRGKQDKSRFRLGRLEVGPGGGDLFNVRHSGALWKTIRSKLPPLEEAASRTPAQAGLNIEGLALAPDGALLVGLRSPTVTRTDRRESKLQEDAIVLRIKAVECLFDAADDDEQTIDLLDAPDDHKDAKPFGGKATLLDLGAQGIRGLCYDRDRDGGAYWILSGLSVDPNHDVHNPWGLWLWDGSGQPRRVHPPADLGLTSPEAMCLVPVDGRPHLLIVDDTAHDNLIRADGEPDIDRMRHADAGCRYALLPTAALKPASPAA
jgi:hypothetical protein